MNKIMYKNMLYNIFIVSCIFISISMTVVKEADIQTVKSVSDSIVNQVIEIEKARVLDRADKFLREKPLTVTAFSCSRSAGGRHDFYSEGPYWWPDPSNPQGPFIRKDGLRNPGNFEKHDNSLRRLSWIVSTHTSAYLLTGEEKYVIAALLHLNAWFADTATMMNPDMLYAQAIKGICTGRGIGIIDAVPLIEVAQSVKILEKSPYISQKDLAPVKKWFSRFLTWLTTHPYGIDEMNAKNNHGSWYLAQIAAYASLVENNVILQECRKRYKEIILPSQMAENGSFPLEIERTKPYSYSLFNLDALAVSAWILSDNSSDLWNYSLADGRGLKKGLAFILPYIKNINKWPYPGDVANWNDQPTNRIFYLFAALAENDAEWYSLWKTTYLKIRADEARISLPMKNPLLWIGLKDPAGRKKVTQ
jgi:hypothetical protein